MGHLKFSVQRGNNTPTLVVVSSNNTAVYRQLLSLKEITFKDKTTRKIDAEANIIEDRQSFKVQGGKIYLDDSLVKYIGNSELEEQIEKVLLSCQL